ncbi:MAG TPA: aminomethyl-transferring glycine dehydrogenase subunit GcvPB [Planctomycetota bacterium]|nr:aminomethyl-transferring glycine dehydrogenase subunit GcvPB [Planctomycetota bacterium]
MNKDLSIFERSRSGRRGFDPPRPAFPAREGASLFPPRCLRRTPPALPEVHELDLVRHYVLLSKKNTSIADSFYPLGSCTMKYNPVANEVAAAMPGFAWLHPFQEDAEAQGLLEVLKRLERSLAALTGLPAVTLHPAAGAQGELTALLVARAFLDDRGERDRRTVLIPDSAHGTNPASVAMAGMEPLPVRSGPDGLVDLADLRGKLGRGTALLMITNPNTLGLFEDRILEIADLLHRAGAFLYMDGANFNAIVGVTRPGDFGVDLMHLNLHKTMSTPHGGGGPGAGPIAVRAEFAPYLPLPRVLEKDGRYSLEWDSPKSIGMLRGFLGNSGVLLRAYAYLRRYGGDGVRSIAEHAVLNANYLRVRIREGWHVPYDRICMHEFVATNRRIKETGIRTLDVAKRLIDLGHHPPTVYFPLIVPEALMIEPTETESKETLDAFAADMLQIAREAQENPDLLREAPVTTPVRRLDEVRAVRQPRLRFPCANSAVVVRRDSPAAPANP